MYPKIFEKSIAAVAAAREKNISFLPPRLDDTERADLLHTYHPDEILTSFLPLQVGASKGERVPTELAALLQAHSRVDTKAVALDRIDHDTDVLIIGGGGAGAAAAIEAHHAGAKVLMVTKLRLGDSNTIMAEGGMQAASQPDDSPATHFLDSFGGGHFAADRELLAKLVTDAPKAIDWLCSLGVAFDRATSGELLTTHGGGTSRKRMHAAKDSTGAEIMRALRDEVLNLSIPVLDYTAAVELLLDENGRAAGAVLMDMDSRALSVVRAKAVIIATGGAGRLHYQNFPTSNHYGATADGLVLAYRAGAKLTDADAWQYHPTGAAFPQHICGALVTEKARALGAKLVNANGEVFVHPLETRDVTTAAIIRECRGRQNGVALPDGCGVWLDTPMIESIHGAGTIETHLPAMLRTFQKCGIDIRREPILVYPTLHYQNGGIAIRPNGAVVGVDRLFAAGEVAGGIHGKNRLMGNALLDIIVFGRAAGKSAATCRDIPSPTLSLAHVAAFEQALNEAQVDTALVSPKLLPNYTKLPNI
ncbi:MAG: FAD-binding protein [Clostridia bacterium]|nr:FAD-binding protein [Clostridia bacterium]